MLLALSKRNALKTYVMILVTCVLSTYCSAEASSASLRASTSLEDSSSEPVIATQRHSLNLYLCIMFIGEAMCYIVSAAFFYYLPLRILTKLSSRIFGFEPSSALYQQTQQKGRRRKKHMVSQVLPLSVWNSRVHDIQVDDHEQKQERIPPLQQPLLAAPERMEMKEAGSSSDPPARFASHAAQDSKLLPVSLHTRPHSLYMMNRLVDFDEAELAAEEQKAAQSKCSAWFACYACLSCYTAQCFSRSCVSKPPSHPTYTLRMLLRQLLTWATFMSINLLFSLIILLSRYKILTSDDMTCPDEVMSTGGSEVWDCFAYSLTDSRLVYITASTYVDCGNSDWWPPEVQAGNSMLCFSLTNPTAEHSLSSLSTVAALLTLVFGGAATIFGWFLASIKSRRAVNFMYLIPATFILMLVLLYFLHQLRTAVGYNSILTVVVLTSIMVRIRKTIGFESEAESVKTAQLLSSSPNAPEFEMDPSDSDSDGSEDDDDDEEDEADGDELSDAENGSYSKKKPTPPVPGPPVVAFYVDDDRKEAEAVAPEAQHAGREVARAAPGAAAAAGVPAANAGAAAQPLVLDAGLRSPASHEVVQIRFTNYHSTAVKVLWIDFQGEEVLYQTLRYFDRNEARNPPSYAQSTYAGHLWVAREVVSGRLVAIENRAWYAAAPSGGELRIGSAEEVAQGLADRQAAMAAALQQEQQQQQQQAGHGQAGAGAARRLALPVNLRSPEEEEEEVLLRFRNFHENPVRIIWVDFEGREVLYQTIEGYDEAHDGEQGVCADQSTYGGHIWVARDQLTEELVAIQGESFYAATGGDVDIKNV